MIHALNMKVADAITDDITASGDLGTATIDTKGYDYLTFICTAGTLDDDLTALTVNESDNSDMSSSSSVIVFQTTTDVAGNTNALSAFDSDESLRYDINLLDRKRYFKFVLSSTGSTNHEVSVVALLSRAEIGLDDNSVSDGGTDFRYRA